MFLPWGAIPLAPTAFFERRFRDICSAHIYAGDGSCETPQVYRIVMRGMLMTTIGVMMMMLMMRMMAGGVDVGEGGWVGLWRWQQGGGGDQEKDVDDSGLWQQHQRQ
jgi:hypothetical protein